MATKKEAAAKKATPKATPKKAAEPVVSQEELLALGEEMNTLLFPGEEVDFSEMSAEEITAQIKADAENIDPKDLFSDDSKATLAAIGIEIEWAAPAAAKKDVAAGKKAAAAKKEAPAKSEGAVKKSGPPRQASPESIARKKMIGDLIEAGKSTAADIIDKVMRKFPDSKESSIRTIISDSKNAKYTAFGKTAKVNDKGVFSF
jgi:hypothetical protein